MTHDDIIDAIAEAMAGWDSIRAMVERQCPSLTEDEQYDLAKRLMDRSLGLVGQRRQANELAAGVCMLQ